MEKVRLQKLKEIAGEYRQECRKKRKAQKVKVKYNWPTQEINLFGLYIERSCDKVVSLKDYKDENNRPRVAPIARPTSGRMFGSIAISFLFGSNFVVELNNMVNGSGQIPLAELETLIDHHLSLLEN